MTRVRQTTEQIALVVQKLDLELVKLKLMDKREGHGWTRDQADHHELEYKRFLTLQAKYPDELIVPSTAADRFWHGHILDTKKYANDCEQVFGYFLHHFPYFGLRGQKDAANFAAASQTTKRLYEQEFGLQEQVTFNHCAVTPPQHEQDCNSREQVTFNHCAVTPPQHEQDCNSREQVTFNHCAVTPPKKEYQLMMLRGIN